MDWQGFRRVVVIGTTGAGKTTLAAELARRLGVLHIELDALHWEANWRPADPEVFRERTAAALAGGRWVTDGNYGAVRDIVWARAEAVVWLNYSLPVVYRQLFKRTLRRLIRKEVLWNGNVERWRDHFLSKESLFYWAWTSSRKHRRQYPVLLQSPEFAHLHVNILRSPQAMRNWLATVPDRERLCDEHR